jgi:hypothetical protein
VGLNVGGVEDTSCTGLQSTAKGSKSLDVGALWHDDTGRLLHQGMAGKARLAEERALDWLALQVAIAKNADSGVAAGTLLEEVDRCPSVTSIRRSSLAGVAVLAAGKGQKHELTRLSMLMSVTMLSCSW